MKSLPNDVIKASRAVYVLFCCYGVIYISFLSRIIHIRELLGGISTAEAGALLLCVSLGSTLAAPIGGALLERVSIRKFIRVFSISSAVLLVLFSFIATEKSEIGCAACAIFMGMCFGLFNVTNNIAGVAIEKRAHGKTLLPRFHAFFQIGAVIGTIISQLISHFGIDLRLQYSLIALVTIPLSIIVSFRLFKTHKVDDELAEEAMEQSVLEKGGFILKLKEKGIDKSVLLISLIVCVCTLAEGAGNDWIASGVVEGFKITEVQGLFAMWIYLLTTATTRFFASRILDRLGRVLTIRICFISALIGVLIYALSPFMFSVYIACIFWGFGVSLGYPVGVSAASESKNNPAFRASIVASLGSVMNIAGPPVIGLLANQITIRLSLLTLLPGIVIALFFLPVLQNKNPKPIESEEK